MEDRSLGSVLVARDSSLVLEVVPVREGLMSGVAYPRLARETKASNLFIFVTLNK
jgi:hypothetical protein